MHSCFANIRKRGFRPRHVLDIGANQGRWSEPCRKVFPEAAFTLVEPQLEMKNPLEAFCERSGNAKWLPVGVSDQAGESPFIVYEDQVSSTFDFDPEKNHRGCEVRTLPVTTVDQLIADQVCPVPDILKIDAEGYEARILKAADSVLGQAELVFLEVQLMGQEADCGFLNLANFMDGKGYAIYDFSWFGRRVQDRAIALAEVVFARKDGFLRANSDIRFATNYANMRKRVA